MQGGAAPSRHIRHLKVAWWFTQSTILALGLGYAVGYLWWPLREHIDATELTRPLLICLGMGLLMSAGSAPPSRPETTTAALGYLAGSLVAWIPGLIFMIQTYLDRTGLATPFDRFFGSAGVVWLAGCGLFFALCFAAHRLIVRESPHHAWVRQAARIAVFGVALAGFVDQWAGHPHLLLLSASYAFATAVIFQVSGVVQGAMAGAAWCATAYWLLPHMRGLPDHPLPSGFLLPCIPYVMAGAVAGAVVISTIERLMDKKGAGA